MATGDGSQPAYPLPGLTYTSPYLQQTLLSQAGDGLPQAHGQGLAHYSNSAPQPQTYGAGLSQYPALHAYGNGSSRYPDVAPPPHTYGGDLPQYPHHPYPTQAYGNGASQPYFTSGQAPMAPEQYAAIDDTDMEDDEPDDYMALATEFGLQNVLNPPDPRTYQNYDSDSEMDDRDTPERPQYGQRLLDNLDGLPLLDDNPARSGDSFDERFQSSLTDDQADGASTRGKSTRGRPRGRGRGRGRGWKWALKGTEHDKSRGRGGQRGRPKGSRASGIARGEGRKRGVGKGMFAAEPGPEFKKLQALATQNFLAERYDEAAKYAREAVQSNPEIFAAHSLLSEVLLAQGNEEDAMTVLMAGAHTKRDGALWHHLAERTLERAGPRRTTNALDTACYCYSWAIKLDSKDFDARLEKTNLLLELHSNHDSYSALGRARAECKMMVKLRPNNLPVIRQYAELCAVSGHQGEVAKAKSAFDSAIEFYSKGETLGTEATDQWSYVNVYLDLVEKVDGPFHGIEKLKKLSRWLLGRADETYWDDFQWDDREYDMQHSPRRVEVQQFCAVPHNSDEDKYGQGLPMEIRIKLGVFRLDLGPQHLAEARHHFEHLLEVEEDIADYVDLYRDVAETLRTRGAFADAVRYYEPLQVVPDELDTGYYMDLAECYRALVRFGDAEDCYKVITEHNPDEWEARVALAKLYEEQGRGPEAVPLIDEVIKMGRNDALKRAGVRFGPLSRPKTTVTVNAESENEIMVPGTSVLDLGPLASGSGLRPIAPMPQGGLIISMPSQGPTPSPDREQSDTPIGPGLVPVTPLRVARRRVPSIKKPKVPRIPDPEKVERANRISEKLDSVRNVGRRIESNWELIKRCRQDVDEGDEDSIDLWMSTAASLFLDFRNTRAFYPGRDKHLKFSGFGKKMKVLTEMERMKHRLLDAGDDDKEQQQAGGDDNVPADFHGVIFSEWLDLFCEYAIRLARDNQRETCYDLLQTTHYANIWYHSLESSQQIHATWLACALLMNDEERLTSVSRWYMSQWPNNPGGYQIFAAVSRLFSGQGNWFNAGPTQKYMLRAIKALDFHLLTDKARERYAFTGQEISSYTQNGKKKPNHVGLEELDPGLFAVYGHILVAAQSWPSALNYYFRAWTLDRDSPMLNLCIASCYLQNSMKRQADNRHMQILQAFSFLGRYYELRTKDDVAIHVQEAEFNMARAWHFLGLNHSAVAGYERCLALRDRVKKEAQREVQERGDDEMDPEEFTQEAAFALASVFAVNENEASARAITEKYLVI